MKYSIFRRAVIAATVFGVASAAASPAFAQDTGWTIEDPQEYRNDSWSFGEIFTVGDEDVTVIALGAFDAFLDGFVTDGGISVGLFDEATNSLLVSTNVVSSDELINNYRYAPISPLNLSSGSQYRVVAVNGNDLYNVALSPSSVNPSITWDGFGYCRSGSLQSCNNLTGSNRTWMANIQFGEITPAVPEPSTWIMLLLGFFAIGGALRRNTSAVRSMKVTYS